MTGGSDGVRAVTASDDVGGAEARAGDIAGKLACAGGRDAPGVGGTLAGRHMGGFEGLTAGCDGVADGFDGAADGFDGVADGFDDVADGFDDVVACAADRIAFGVLGGVGERTGFGGALASAEPRSGSGGTLASPSGVQRAGFAGTTDSGADFGAALARAEGRADVGTTGTSPLVAAFTGRLWDSGTSSQPESTASSSESARFSVPREPPSAPFAIPFKVPEPLAAWQVRTALLYVAVHRRFSEPRCAFLGT